MVAVTQPGLTALFNLIPDVNPPVKFLAPSNCTAFNNQVNENYNNILAFLCIHQHYATNWIC